MVELLWSGVFPVSSRQGSLDRFRLGEGELADAVDGRDGRRSGRRLPGCERRSFARRRNESRSDSPSSWPLRTWRECPLRARGAVSAVAEEALGSGAVVSHWHEVATVEVLAVDYRRIVELVAATRVRAESSVGEPSSVGTGDGRTAAHAVRSPRGSPVRNSRAGTRGTHPGVISRASSPWPGRRSTGKCSGTWSANVSGPRWRPMGSRVLWNWTAPAHRSRPRPRFPVPGTVLAPGSRQIPCSPPTSVTNSDCFIDISSRRRTVGSAPTTVLQLEGVPPTCANRVR